MQLEKQNFKISSKGWKKLKDYKENPEGDIWEITKGEFKGEQLFTWDAAMRETKKAGKRMPTKDEWEKLYSDKIPDFPKVGYRNFSNGYLYNQGGIGNYWSSSFIGTYAFSMYFGFEDVNPADFSSRAHGFSVRCVKELLEDFGKLEAEKIIQEELEAAAKCPDPQHLQNAESRGFCYSCTDIIKERKISTKYELTDGTFEIKVKVMEDGTLTIRTGHDKREFRFEQSEPETVRAIAKLILKATEL